MAYLGKAQVQAKLKPPKKRLTQTVPYCPLLFGSEADPNLWAKKADNLNPQELSLVQLLLRSVFSLKTRDFKTVQDAIPVLQSRLEALCGQSATIGTPPQSKNKGMNSGADQILKGDGDKQAAYPAETLASMRVYTKYLIDYFEASLQFAQGKFPECIKRLNSLASPKAVTQGINSQGISGPFQDFFAENGLGCVYLKMNKPALALLSFNKAMARLRQLSDESIKEIHKENKRVEAICVGSKTSRVLYNMALSQLKLGNYEVAWKLFERASSDNVANFTFWYRFGVCGFNWFLKECELRSFKVAVEITKEKNELIEPPKDESDGIPQGVEGKHNQQDFLRRFFLQTDKPDKRLPYDMLTKALGYFYNCLVLIEKKKLAQSSVEAIRKKLDTPLFEEEEKSLKSNEQSLQKYLQAQEERLNEIMLSSYHYICHITLCLKQSKRTIYYATKGLKMPKLSDRDKFVLGMYRAEALMQLGSIKQGIASLKELSLKPELQLKCSFGYASPWIDKTVDYSSRTVYLLNLANMAMNEESEINSKELTEAIKHLTELFESKSLKGVTPLASFFLYNYLRKGQNSQAVQLIKRRKLQPAPSEQQTAPTPTPTPSK